MSAFWLIKISRSKRYDACSDVVRLKGLEPTRIAAREPKSRMSTNSITGAYSVFEITGVENGAVNLSLR